MTNAEFEVAVNARFGENSPCLSHIAAIRTIDAIDAFPSIMLLMDVEPYIHLLQRIDDAKIMSFFRYFVASVRRHKQVATNVTESLTSVIAGHFIDHEERVIKLLQLIGSHRDAQIALILCLQHYFS